ncbi:MAG: carbohydrate porin [Nitrospinae bacterium]|nr:carbohydrate porin [Nitrospinota bacterium]
MNTSFRYIFIVSFILLSSFPAFAQAPAYPDIEELKRRVEQLEKEIEKAHPSPEEKKEWHKAMQIEGTLNYLHQVSDKTKDYASSSQGTGSGDLFITAEAINGFAFINISFQQGGGIDQDIPTLNGLNNDVTNGAHLFTRPGDPNTGVNNAEPFIARFYYQGHSSDEKFHITIGKFCVNDFFDNNAVANSQTTQFYSAALVNSAAFSYGQDDSGYTQGIMLAYKFTGDIEFKTAGVSANGEWDNVFKKNNLWYIGELDWKTNFMEKGGNYRFYYYLDVSPHTKYASPADTTASSAGFGLSFDQVLSGDISAFVRYASHDGSVTTTYYNYSINQHVLISLDFQYIMNPAADADKAAVSVYGTRLHVEF